MLCAVPLVATGWPPIAAFSVAAPPTTVGIFVERRLFFAEAKHAVTLYCGGSPA